MDDLLPKLASWHPFTVLVVGDFMLDETILGDAERLTGDAPVPILHVREVRQTPGGAANVCMNLAAMHGHVLAFGVVGDDAEGKALRTLLEQERIDCTGLITDAARPTTVKRSLVGRAQHRHAQKMFRIDVESREPLNPEASAKLLAAFDVALAKVDVVAIEDYDKGVLQGQLCAEFISRARRAGKEVIVDPARLTDYARYRGATSITPNRTEAETATGLPTHSSADAAHNAELARAIQKSCEIDAVVLTLDRHGALLLEKDREPLAVPTVAREVYDVTGAGDMVLAALAAARANHFSWPDAVKLANVAAGLEVEIFGVQPIPFDRIRREVTRTTNGTGSKLYDRADLQLEVNRRRSAGQRIVLTNGCFDVLHSGHVMLIEEARRQGDFLIVAINTDEKVRQFKGPNRPVHSQHERAQVLSGLQAVDAVTIFPEETPLELIHTIRPDVLVKGAEYSIEQIPGADFIKGYGGRIARIDMKAGFSTTETLRKMGHPAAEVITSEETRRQFIMDRPAQSPR